MNRRRVLPWVAGIFLTLFAVLGGLYAWLLTSLPQIDGELSLPGLESPVRIERNPSGIPHIVAGNSHDAAFALGFVHAQDRIFQMDLLRRFGAGEIAEIAGKSQLNRDKFMRTLGFSWAAQQQFSQLDTSTKDILRAYADGINAYIKYHSGARFPLYYFISGPRPWQPADSILISNVMSFYLAQNYHRELLHARMARFLTPDQLHALFPAYPKNAPVTLENLAGIYRKLPLERLAAVSAAATAIAEASNDWVVDGSHTATGKPILENDPHLTYTAPAIWYLARVDFPGYQLSGGTIPGEPFVVVGHNGHVGWGFSETGGDVEDVFIEKIDPNDAGRYLTPTGSEAFKTRQETIHVKGGKDVVLTVRSTRHGPVLTDIIPGSQHSSSSEGAFSSGSLWPAPKGYPGKGYVLTLQTTFLNAGNLTAQAFWKMNLARDWSGFRAALGDFTAPQMNIVYADTSGTIAFMAPARVPIRKSGQGWIPHPGWTGDYDWIGYIPFDKLPQAVNPPAGRFVAANNKIVPDSYPFFITRDWAPPYRASRINELLDTFPKLTLNQASAITADVESLMAKHLLPVLLSAGAQAKGTLPEVSELAAWDHAMDRDKSAPLIFVAWLREINRKLFKQRLGPAFEGYWKSNSLAIDKILTGSNEWCKQAKAANCSEILSDSLKSALKDIESKAGSGPSHWRWGDFHRARFWDAALSSIPFLGNFLDPSIPVSGGDETVNAGDMNFADKKDPFRATAGPGFRMILDFSDLSRSRFLIAPGMSENPLSAHYGDLLKRWRDFDWIDVAHMAAANSLTLLPSGQEADRIRSARLEP